MSSGNFGTVNATGLNVTGILQASQIVTSKPMQVSNLSVGGLDLVDALNAKANLVSPSFTGNVSVSGNVAASGMTINGNAVATTNFVSTQIASVIGTAGAALDTLGELSNALSNDASFSTTVNSHPSSVIFKKLFLGVTHLIVVFKKIKIS